MHVIKLMATGEFGQIGQCAQSLVEVALQQGIDSATIQNQCGMEHRAMALLLKSCLVTSNSVQVRTSVI